MVDVVKILGSLLSNNAMGSGGGSNLLGSLIGSALGGGQSSAAGGMGGMGGGLGGMLAGLAGGAGGAGGAGALGALAGMLGGGMGGQAQQQGEGGSMGLNSFGSAAAQEPDASVNDQATVLIRAMVSAAKSDGRVDESEQQNIVERLGDVGQDELDYVREELARPLDIQGLISSVPQGLEQQVYAVSLMTIDLDSNEEAQYLHQLAQGMGIDQHACNALHDQLGAPKLYS